MIVFGAWLTQKLFTKHFDKKPYVKPYRGAFFIVMLWAVIIGVMSQEFRTRNVIAQSLDGPSAQEPAMTQSVYKPTDDIQKSEPEVDTAAMLESNKAANASTKERFNSL